MKTNVKNIDILCVGELLIDFIGHQSNVQINQTEDYRRFLGGSPTNLAIYCSKLGIQSALVASIGKDGLGEFVVENLQKEAIDLQHLKMIKNKSTSVIFVSRTDGTPDFIPYRDADFCIDENQLPTSTLERTKIFHTTCFALSKDIAQTTILKKAKEAYEAGCELSIDLNYAEKIWDSEKSVLEVFKEYGAYKPLIKISEDDVFRIFNKKLSHQEIFDFFHQLGAKIICLTLGSEGVVLSKKGSPIIELPAKKITKIEDATGAGDAFWAGFISAYVQDQSLKICLEKGLKVAAIKLQNIGGLPKNLTI